MSDPVPTYNVIFGGATALDPHGTGAFVLRRDYLNAVSERDAANAIIDAIMREVPAGYYPAHTPENLPGRIAELVQRDAQLHNELDAAEKRCEALEAALKRELNGADQAVIEATRQFLPDWTRHFIRMTARINRALARQALTTKDTP